MIDYFDGSIFFFFLVDPRGRPNVLVITGPFTLMLEEMSQNTT